jgi:hypothetical protein
MLRRLAIQGFHFNPSIHNRSKVNGDDLMERLSRFFSPRRWEPDKGKLHKAVKAGYSAFARYDSEAYLQPLPWKEEFLIEHIQPESNSGAPYWTRKREAFYMDFFLAGDILLGKKGIPPCTPFSRAGFGEDGPRPRLIWGYPEAMVLIEAAVMVPLLDHLKDTLRTPMAFGISKTELRAGTQTLERFDTRIGVDASAFDSSLNAYLINRAFDILFTWIDPTAVLRVWDGSFHHDVPIRKVMKIIRQYYVATTIIMPDGFVYRKQRGTPSGSFGTALVNSTAMFIAVQYAMLEVTNRMVPKEYVLVLGDDALIGTNMSVKKGAFAKALANVGITLNEEKTEFTRHGEPIHFLGHYWHKGMMTRPLRELAQRCGFPERPDTLRNVHWRTRTTIILLSCDNGVEILAKLFGLTHYEELHLLPLPGPLPVVGLDAITHGQRPRASAGIVENLAIEMARG